LVSYADINGFFVTDTARGSLTGAIAEVTKLSIQGGDR